MKFFKDFYCLVFILNLFQIALVNGQSRLIYCRNYETDIDFQGNDLDTARFFVKSKEECLSLCSAAQQCTGFTFEYTTGYCFLKTFNYPIRVAFFGRLSCAIETNALTSMISSTSKKPYCSDGFKVVSISNLFLVLLFTTLVLCFEKLF